MNMNQNPTAEELRNLLSECDDRSGHHILWVADDGGVRITRIPKNESPLGFERSHPEMKLRIETFQAGNDYVGSEAAEDVGWVSDLFRTLTNRWRTAKNKAGVEYVDQF